MLKGTMLGINGLQILSKALLAFKIFAKMNSVSDADTDVTDLVLFVSTDLVTDSIVEVYSARGRVFVTVFLFNN